MAQREATFVLRLGVALATLAPACGGSGAAPSPSPSPGSSPGSIANPCTAALAATEAPSLVRASAHDKEHGGLGNDKRDPRESVWAHRAAGLEGRVEAQSGRAAAAADVGDIAVLQDDGSLIVSANPFDLAGLGVRFQKNPAGGYDVARTDATFRPSLGQRLNLADDDTFRLVMPFAFPFYGGAPTTAFVNSDGNVTFGVLDTGTDERGLVRLLSGPPRVAPFFADLDPSKGGAIFVSSGPDALTVTWCAVRGFDSPSTVTAQTTLLPDGSVDVKFASVDLRAGIVAVSPGATQAFTPADLRAVGPTVGGAGAIGERFASTSTLDLVGAVRRFYESHSDSYDQLVLWTDTGVVESGTFAFESTVANSIEGIGAAVTNFSGQFGSAGQLQSVVLMDNLGKYPADPTTRANGENTTLSVLGHESGHRWLALLRFKDAAGAVSDLLLGRQLAHWSFFFDSDASVMEGNDIVDLGGGSFQTLSAVERYSRLDLYAMGLAEPFEVLPFYFVEGPTGATQNRESAPRTGVTFQGKRHEVTIEDVVAAMGARRPSARQSPRLHRQAFVYVVGRGRVAEAAAIEKLERFRSAWEPFFATATSNRMVLETRLR